MPKVWIHSHVFNCNNVNRKIQITQHVPQKGFHQHHLVNKWSVACHVSKEGNKNESMFFTFDTVKLCKRRSGKRSPSFSWNASRQCQSVCGPQCPRCLLHRDCNPTVVQVKFRSAVGSSVLRRLVYHLLLADRDQVVERIFGDTCSVWRRHNQPLVSVRVVCDKH